MIVNTNRMIEIKKAVLYYFNEFMNEVNDKEIAIELTKEAMTTYRTFIISEQKKEHEDKITEKQLKLLRESLNDFRENKIIAEELRRFGKSSIEELTKKEATEIISRIINS